ncbi:MAG: hypothetical protein LBG06_07450 [Deltaproteobacteria bacterium]|jgi:hypothetical protein|nr:hypothetical protein [Deltaproteobacteria bacterium]
MAAETVERPDGPAVRHGGEAGGSGTGSGHVALSRIWHRDLRLGLSREAKAVRLSRDSGILADAFDVEAPEAPRPARSGQEDDGGGFIGSESPGIGMSEGLVSSFFLEPWKSGTASAGIHEGPAQAFQGLPEDMRRRLGRRPGCPMPFLPVDGQAAKPGVCERGTFSGQPPSLQGEGFVMD